MGFWISWLERVIIGVPVALLLSGTSLPINVTPHISIFVYTTAAYWMFPPF